MNKAEKSARNCIVRSVVGGDHSRTRFVSVQLYCTSSFIIKYDGFVESFAVDLG